jgi:hypothetical protein
MVIIELLVWAAVVFSLGYFVELWAAYDMMVCTLIYVVLVSRGKSILLCLVSALFTALVSLSCSKLLQFFGSNKNDIFDLTLLTIVVAPIAGGIIIYEKVKGK